MTENLYNLSFLIRMEVGNYKKVKFVKHKERFSFLGFTIQKEGYYTAFGRIEGNIEHYLKDMGFDIVIKEKEIFEKPYLRCYFQGEFETIGYFESFEDAQQEAEKIKKLTGIEWIKTVEA